MRKAGTARVRAAVLLLGFAALAPAPGCTVSVDRNALGKGVDAAGIGATSLVPGKGHPEIWAEPDAWVLVANPRHQPDDAMERRDPRWVWARRDSLPVTVNRVAGGERMLLAPDEIQKKYAADKVPPAGWRKP